MLIGGFATASNAIVDFFIKDHFLLVMNIYLASSYFLVYLFQKHFNLKTVLYAGLAILCFGCLASSVNSSAELVWLTLVPIVGIACLGQTQGTALAIVTYMIAALYTLGYYTINGALIHPFPHLFATSSSYIVLTITGYFFALHTQRNQNALMAERSKRERLEIAQNLAGGVAHLINNEMQTVSNSVYMLEKESSNSYSKKHLKNIISSASKSGHHANQLLAYAHIGQLQVEPLNLNLLLESIHHKFSNRHSDIDLSLSTNVQTTLTVNGDKNQITHVFTSIITNAYDAIQVKLDQGDLTQGNIQTDLVLDDANNDCIISIHDNGCGMNEDLQSMIFEPFYSTKFTGRGMDLAATYGIVTNHGGTLSVESKENKGSTFYIRLPLMR
ncbi:MAG: ATP-binding protein [Ghiorsea sp.]